MRRLLKAILAAVSLAVLLVLTLIIYVETSEPSDQPISLPFGSAVGVGAWLKTGKGPLEETTLYASMSDGTCQEIQMVRVGWFVWRR